MIGSQNMFPPVVKNLLIINVILFIATYYVFPDMGINLKDFLGLHYWKSDFFKPWQFVTYIFMHADESHLFFNMFAIWMFGSAIENYWGSKRFLNYYIITGIGAAIIHYFIIHIQASLLEPLLDQQTIDLALQGKYYPNRLTPNSQQYLSLVGGLVGASGSLFGILLAYGMSFPNHKIYLYFLFPIKAKYLVMGYGFIELYSGIENNPGDNVAHFAHLGGMLVGFITIWYWRKNNSNFY